LEPPAPFLVLVLLFALARLGMLLQHKTLCDDDSAYAVCEKPEKCGHGTGIDGKIGL
jgi:hypothetical protein